jgi:hypothetical protein
MRVPYSPKLLAASHPAAAIAVSTPTPTARPVAYAYLFKQPRNRLLRAVERVADHLLDLLAERLRAAAGS